MKKKRILSFLLGMLLLTSVFLPTALAYAESAAAPSLPSPIASWDFENGNDPYTSSTSAAQKLVPGGSKLPLLDSSAVNGGSGGLRLFDRGSTLLTPNAPFDKSASYTCSMWVKIDDAQPAQGAPAYYSFFHLKDDKGWLSVIRENDATAYFRSNWGGFGMDTPTRVRTTNIAESIGAWHHVVLTYHHDAKNAANKRATLYIDGLEELYFTGKTAGPNNAKPFYLGSTKGGTEQVSMLDEISFYQTDLSAEQVALLYSEQKPVPSIEFVTSSDAMGKIYDGQPVSDPEIKTDSTGTVIFSYYTDDSGAPGTILSGGAPRNAGTYWVRARFAAADADAADSAQQMFTIQKAATLPGDVPSTPPLLTGRNGQPVSTVALPTGYNWTNGTELLREGTHAYHAAYSKDPVNYTGVPVQLDVTSAEYSDSGRYKNPELLIPNVIASETDPASGHTYPRNVNGSQTPRTAQYGIFDHTQWEFSEALSDEFNGTELNTDKWYPYYMDWWKATPGPAVEEGDVVIRDDGDVSRLVLHGTKNRELTFGGAPKHNTYRGFGIMGGAKDYLNYGPNTPGYPIVNHAPYHDALATTYGFFEVRTKFDIGNGSIPAIWFVGFQDEGGNAKSAEIDWPEMFNAEEYPGRDNKLSIWHLKNVNAGGSWERPTTDTPIAKYLDPNEDYRTDWHTIGVEWGENYVRYFFDGHLIGEYAAKIPYRMIPIISFNYRPYNNDGTLKDSTAGAKPEMQRDFEIDYYRVWKNKDVADPYEEPSLPESGNIASYAYISQFGLTSAQYDATPPELLNDGDYTKVALSGLQTKNLDGSDCGETHTKLPAYTFVDFRGPVDYNTVILYSTYAQSQAPTLVDIQINRASGRIDNGSVWETVAADVPLVWKTNTSQPESCVIRIPRTVAGNEHMRIVVKEANFNASGRFGISEIEIGTDLEAAQIAFPEYEEPIIPQKQTLPQAAAHWNFEGDTPLADSIAQKEISVYLHGSTAKPLPEFSAVNTLANGATGASYNGSTTASLFPLTGALNLKQDFTLSLWVKMDALPSELGHTCTLIQLPSGQGNHMFLSVDQSDTLQTYYGGNSAAGNTKLVADKWYNVIFSKNNSSISVYLNGQPELTSTKTAAYNASGLVIGNSRIGSENQGLSGQLDEVSFYPASFTAPQAAWYYYDTSTGEKNRVSTVEQPEDIYADIGTDLALLLPPEKVRVRIDNQYQTMLQLEKWALTSIDPTISGSYTLETALVLERQISNPNGLTAQLQIHLANRAPLRKAIHAANTLYVKSTEGSLAGQYPTGAKGELLSAIEAAGNSLNTRQMTQAQLEAAQQALTECVAVFEGKRNNGFSITVTDGSADKKEAVQGEIVTVTAAPPAKGEVFHEWICDDQTVVFTDRFSARTSFTMPGSTVTVRATYKRSSDDSSSSGSTPAPEPPSSSSSSSQAPVGPTGSTSRPPKAPNDVTSSPPTSSADDAASSSQTVVSDDADSSTPPDSSSVASNMPTAEDAFDGTVSVKWIAPLIAAIAFIAAIFAGLLVYRKRKHK